MFYLLMIGIAPASAAASPRPDSPLEARLALPVQAPRPPAPDIDYDLVG